MTSRNSTVSDFCRFPVGGIVMFKPRSSGKPLLTPTCFTPGERCSLSITFWMNCVVASVDAYALPFRLTCATARCCGCTPEGVERRWRTPQEEVTQQRAEVRQSQSARPAASCSCDCPTPTLQHCAPPADWSQCCGATPATKAAGRRAA